MVDEWERLRQEIRRLEQEHTAARREVEPSRSAPAQWIFAEGTLCWFVVLEDVLEPDIDVEVRPEILVVRGRASSDDELVSIVLPVPRGFDPGRARFRFRSSTLEIRIDAVEGAR